MLNREPGGASPDIIGDEKEGTKESALAGGRRHRGEGPTFERGQEGT